MQLGQDGDSVVFVFVRLDVCTVVAFFLREDVLVVWERGVCRPVAGRGAPLSPARRRFTSGRA
jgi:hypothetical protein